jgi:hypothetical protein
VKTEGSSHDPKNNYEECIRTDYRMIRVIS